MRKRRLYPTESSEQIALMEYSRLMAKTRPEWGYLVHIPNEGERDGGASHWYWQMGLKRGFPDLALFVPRGDKHGLFIELKRRRGGRVTPEQHIWLQALDAQGYQVKIAYGAEEAIRTIENYLGGNDGKAKVVRSGDSAAQPFAGGSRLPAAGVSATQG